MQRAKEGREPTQSEMFIETRKGNKGKQMDVETGKVIVSQNLTVIVNYVYFIYIYIYIYI
jgi:hypothetical protein